MKEKELQKYWEYWGLLHDEAHKLLEWYDDNIKKLKKNAIYNCTHIYRGVTIVYDVEDFLNSTCYYSDFELPLELLTMTSSQRLEYYKQKEAEQKEIDERREKNLQRHREEQKEIEKEKKYQEYLKLKEIYE